MMYHLLIIGVGLIAGMFGVLAGLGGGAIIVPCLTLIPYFGISMHEAIAASIVGVLITSLGGSSRYIDEGFTDIKLGMVLALGTASGAIVGSLVSRKLDDTVLGVIFSLVLIYVSYEMIKNRPKKDTGTIDNYKHYPAGFVLTGISGILAGMLGVGGGAINVPVMHLVMDVPMKITTATSNFMIGATASAAVFVYLLKGSIDFSIAAPVGLGVFIGAKAGSALLKHINTIALKRIFTVIIIIIAVEMFYNAMKAYL